MNKTERELKLFELNRTLSYVSEILKLKRTLSEIEKKIFSENREKSDWLSYIYELKKLSKPDNEAVSDIEKIIAELEKSIESKKITAKEISEKIYIYKNFVSNMCIYIFSFDQDHSCSCRLQIEREEFEVQFLEEYVYLLTEIEVDGVYDWYSFDEIFADKEDIARLILQTYGEDTFDIICEILQNDRFESSFEDLLCF